jgi:hypothetical protein
VLAQTSIPRDGEAVTRVVVPKIQVCNQTPNHFRIVFGKVDTSLFGLATGSEGEAFPKEVARRTYDDDVHGECERAAGYGQVGECAIFVGSCASVSKSSPPYLVLINLTIASGHACCLPNSPMVSRVLSRIW